MTVPARRRVVQCTVVCFALLIVPVCSLTLFASYHRISMFFGGALWIPAGLVAVLSQFGRFRRHRSTIAVGMLVLITHVAYVGMLMPTNFAGQFAAYIFAHAQHVSMFLSSLAVLVVLRRHFGWRIARITAPTSTEDGPFPFQFGLSALLVSMGWLVLFLLVCRQILTGLSSRELTAVGAHIMIVSLRAVYFTVLLILSMRLVLAQHPSALVAYALMVVLLILNVFASSDEQAFGSVMIHGFGGVVAAMAVCFLWRRWGYRLIVPVRTASASPSEVD